MARIEYIESEKESCLEILRHIEDEDSYIRQRMLRECKQNELYWHGFQYIFWDERVQDFRIPTHDVMEQVSSREEVKFIYDYVVNIFKAHGLSIIAAVTSEIPGVSFSPFDSDNPKDVLAARKAETLFKIISKKNKSKLLFYHALFTLYTNHFVAAYNYYERDKKFGSVKIPKFSNGKLTSDSWNCADNCGFTSSNETEKCPDCGGNVVKQEGETGPIQVGTEEQNLGMINLSIWGTLNIKIPTYAVDQAACGYLIQYSDQHFAFLRNLYKDTVDRDDIGLMSIDNFERIARMPSVGRLYSDTYLNSLLTLKRVWVRNWMYDVLDEDAANELHKKYPDGMNFHVIDGGSPLIAHIENEDLDDHWTITKGDLSRSIHGDPLSKPLLPIQDLENMVANLLVESLEHSVPSTFADTEMIDFELYSHQEVVPGAVYPTKQPLGSNRKMEDYFYTLKTSVLPKEGVEFEQIVDSKGQFLVGAFPSIFGGPQTEGSKTLGEYQESRNFALQRLSIVYNILYFWWADIGYKSVKEYIGNMISDEKYSNKAANGRFEAVNFLMDDFTDGRFQLLLPESSIDLPVSFSQKRGQITQMIQLNSDIMNQFLFSPENRRVTLRYLGIEDMNDLDSEQTVKQLLEIEGILSGEVVNVEPIIDDDEVHLRVIRTYICSENGQEEKKMNPTGYNALMQHAQKHYQNLMAKMQGMQNQQPPNKQPQQNKQPIKPQMKQPLNAPVSAPLNGGTR